MEGWQFADALNGIKDQPYGVPLIGDIHAVVNAAFFSSIQREESEFITFSLMFLTTHIEARPRHKLTEHNDFIKFSDPRVLTVEEIRKLAGAIDARSSAIAIERQEERYIVTGIIPFGRRPSPLSVITAGFPRPEALTVIAQGPGSLTIGRADRVIGRYIAGEFIPAEPTPFHSKALGEDFIRRIELKHRAYQEFSTSYWYQYAGSLQHILGTASEKGHGGTIIWLPKEVVEPARQIIVHGRRIENFTPIYSKFLELLVATRASDNAYRTIFDLQEQGASVCPIDVASNAISMSMRSPTARATLGILLNAIAQLSCVDGALLIDEFFQPIHFGARLQASQWFGPVKRGPMPPVWRGASQSRDFERSRFGTRHNSAIDFVGAVPGAVAFALSQDGPVRAITRRGDTVYIWPDCLNTVFVE